MNLVIRQGLVLGYHGNKQLLIEYIYGVWGSDNEEKYSSYREFRKLLKSVKEMANNGELNGVKLFIFIDNPVNESGVFKSSSTIRLSFELVLRLNMVEQ